MTKNCEFSPLFLPISQKHHFHTLFPYFFHFPHFLPLSSPPATSVPVRRPFGRRVKRAKSYMWREECAASGAELFSRLRTHTYADDRININFIIIHYSLNSFLSWVTVYFKQKFVPYQFIS